MPKHKEGNVHTVEILPECLDQFERLRIVNKHQEAEIKDLKTLSNTILELAVNNAKGIKYGSQHMEKPEKIVRKNRKRPPTLTIPTLWSKSPIEVNVSDKYSNILLVTLIGVAIILIAINFI